MSHRPSRWVETAGELLTPPASREHVLGDLAECSRSNGQYLANLASILPGVVWSQIRRRSSLGWTTFRALFSGYVLGALQAYFNAPFMNEPSGWLRLAAPWAIWVAGNLLATAYGPPDQPSRQNLKVLGGAVLAATGAAALLGASVTGVLAAFGVILASIVLLTMPWLQHQAMFTPLSLETLPERAHTFQRTIWWRNVRESAACVFVLFMIGRSLGQMEDPLERAGQLLLMAGVLFVAYFLHFHARPRTVPQDADAATLLRFHRREIARQRDILRAVPWWYLAPFAPGFLTIAASKWAVSAGESLGLLLLMAGLFVLIGLLNRWGARWLDQQLRAADTLADTMDGRRS